MSDDDTVVTDQDLLDEQSYDALTLNDIESSGRRAQTREKCGQRFGETQISSAVSRLVCNRLQLGTDCVFAPGANRACDGAARRAAKDLPGRR